MTKLDDYLNKPEIRNLPWESLAYDLTIHAALHAIERGSCDQDRFMLIALHAYRAMTASLATEAVLKKLKTP